MSAPQQILRRWSTLAIVVFFLTGFGSGYITSEIVGSLSGLAPEYNSAAVIRGITEFVEQKEQWPTSWQDLRRGPMDRVQVNWTLNVNTCDRYDVMTSVAPSARSFYTYPHAERDLRGLWDVIVKIQNRNSHKAMREGRP